MRNHFKTDLTNRKPYLELVEPALGDDTSNMRLYFDNGPHLLCERTAHQVTACAGLQPHDVSAQVPEAVG